MLAAAQGWRTRLLHGAALTLCFALPVVGYMSYSAVILHYGFELSNMGDAYLYGRAAHAADCATLKIPADERPLCPSPSVAATLGVDGLVNDENRAARAVPAGQRPAGPADQHPAAADASSPTACWRSSRCGWPATSPRTR